MISVGTFQGRDITVQFGLIGTAQTFQVAVRSKFFEPYLGSPGRPTPFGGRGADIRRLNSWLTDRHTSRNLLVSAPAGRGKSALLVRWIEQLPENVRRTFLPISIRADTNQPSVFYEALAARLATLLGEEPPSAPYDKVNYFREKIREYFERFADANNPCVVVIDGLDEAIGWQVDDSLLPRDPPPGLKVVVSARQTAERRHRDWLVLLGWAGRGVASSFEVGPLDRDGVADVLARMGDPLAHLGQDVDIVGELLRLSDGGDPLLIGLYVGVLAEEPEKAARLRPTDLAALRPGFADFFMIWLEHQKRAWREAGRQWNEDEIDLIFAVLACAQGPLLPSDIGAVLNEVAPRIPSRHVTERSLEPVGRFVIGDRVSGYVLAHPKLGQFLRETHFAGSDLMQRVLAGFLAWGGRTVDAVNAPDGDPDSVPRYLLVYYLQHLQQDRRAPLAAYRALAEDGWRRACSEREGGDGSFSEQLETCFRRLLEAARATPARLATPGTGLGGLIHIALCLASLRSLGTSIPPNFIAEMVRQDFLGIRRALFVSRFRSDQERADVLSLLAPVAKSDVFEIMLAGARQLRDRTARARAIIGVASCWPAPTRGRLVEDAIREVALGEYVTEYGRSEAIRSVLAAVEAHTPTEIDAAYAMANSLIEAEDGVGGLFTPGRPSPALAETTRPNPPQEQTHSFSPGDLFNDWRFVDLPDELRAVLQRLRLTPAKKFSDADFKASLELVFELHPVHWPELLDVLARFLPPTMVDAAIDLVFGRDSSYWLGEALFPLALRLPDDALSALIERIICLLELPTQPDIRTYGGWQALLLLLPLLSHRSFCAIWPRIFSLRSDFNARRVLVAVRDRLDSDHLSALLDRCFAREVDWEEDQVLEIISSVLPHALLESAVDRCLAIGTSWTRKRRLAALLPTLGTVAPDLLERVVNATRDIGETSERLSMLDQVLPFLDLPRRRQAIEEVHRLALEIADGPVVVLARAAFNSVAAFPIYDMAAPSNLFLRQRKTDASGAVYVALGAMLASTSADQARQLLLQARRLAEGLDSDVRTFIATVAALCPKLSRLEGEAILAETQAMIDKHIDDASGRAVARTLLLFSHHIAEEEASRLVMAATAVMRDADQEVDIRLTIAAVLAVARPVPRRVADEAIEMVEQALDDAETKPPARLGLAAAFALSHRIERSEAERRLAAVGQVPLPEREQRDVGLLDLAQFALLPYLDDQMLPDRALDFVARLAELPREFALLCLVLVEGGWGDTLGLKPAISAGAPGRGLLARIGGPSAVTEAAAAVDAVARWWP